MQTISLTWTNYVFIQVFVMHGDNSRCNKVDTDNEEIENTSWSAIMSWYDRLTNCLLFYSIHKS
jgi:hypothetical protein